MKSAGEIIGWYSSPVLTFVIIDPHCKKKNVVIVSLDVEQFYVQYSGKYDSFVERE